MSSLDKREKHLLRLIQIVPVLLVTIFFIIIFIIVVGAKIKDGRQNIKDIQNNILQIKKERMKNEVSTLFEHIDYQRKMARVNLKKELKQQVDMAYKISQNIYKQNKIRDKQAITKMIKDALRPIRFNYNRGYFFIYSMSLRNILLPIAPSLEGEDFSNYRDIKGDLVVRNIANLCRKNGSAFYTWYWKKPNNGFKGFKKVGYARYFQPLDWFIGTGEYVIDFDKNLQKDIYKEIEYTRYYDKQYFFILKRGDENLPLYRKIAKQIKQSDRFLVYKNRIYYGIKLKKWNWIVGSSENLDNMRRTIKKEEKELKRELYNTTVKLIVIFILVAVLLVLLLFMLVQKSKIVFLKYKNTILGETEKSKKQLIMVQNQNKLASMGEMLGNISHQWKQPLNALGISVSKIMLLEEEGHLTKDMMKKSLARMEKNITYLSNTIDIFRDFFKASKSIQDFNLKNELEEVVCIAQCSLEDSLIRISCICDDDVFLRGDKKKLEQVFLNILNNAKDAIVENSIKNGTIEIKTVKIEKIVKIIIQDNALGVPKDIEDKIFEPYFTTKAQHKGTGVGLYMSKIIIENHFQGKLSFENRDKGAMFIVALPLE